MVFPTFQRERKKLLCCRRGRQTSRNYLLHSVLATEGSILWNPLVKSSTSTMKFYENIWQVLKEEWRNHLRIERLDRQSKSINLVVSSRGQKAYSYLQVDIQSLFKTQNHYLIELTHPEELCALLVLDETSQIDDGFITSTLLTTSIQNIAKLKFREGKTYEELLERKTKPDLKAHPNNLKVLKNLSNKLNLSENLMIKVNNY